jgi:hypothetical protein
VSGPVPCLAGFGARDSTGYQGYTYPVVPITLSVDVLNYVTLMLSFGKSVHRKDNVDLKSTTEGNINMNADKKLVVDPCNDRPINDFVGQSEKFRFGNLKPNP